MWSFVQGDPVNWLVRRVQHTHGNKVLPVRNDCFSDIQYERGFCSFVSTNPLTVHPDFSKIVDRPEPEQIFSGGVAISVDRELPPVPCDPVVSGEDALDDPGDVGEASLGPDRGPPVLTSPFVARVTRDQPFTVKTVYHGKSFPERRSGARFIRLLRTEQNSRPKREAHTRALEC